MKIYNSYTLGTIKFKIGDIFVMLYVVKLPRLISKRAS